MAWIVAGKIRNQAGAEVGALRMSLLSGASGAAAGWLVINRGGVLYVAGLRGARADYRWRLSGNGPTPGAGGIATAVVQGEQRSAVSPARLTVAITGSGAGIASDALSADVQVVRELSNEVALDLASASNSEQYTQEQADRGLVWLASSNWRASQIAQKAQAWAGPLFGLKGELPFSGPAEGGAPPVEEPITGEGEVLDEDLALGDRVLIGSGVVAAVVVAAKFAWDAFKSKRGGR